MKKSFSKLAAFTTSVLLLFSFLPILNQSSVAMAATTTLRPNDAGDSTQLNSSPCEWDWWHWEWVCVSNYDAVNDETSDGDDAYVYYEHDSNYKIDLYSLPNPSLTGTINSVTVNIEAKRKSGTYTPQSSAKTAIKIGGTVYYGDEQTLTPSYSTYSKTYTINPKTSSVWTWANIDDLQIGVALRKAASDKYSRVTRVWVVVDYTALPTTGTLTVIKHVINDNGGTATASNFNITVTGSSPSPASFAGVESPGTTVTLGVGSYSVSESGLSGYGASYSADCSGTIAAGGTKTCTITNDDQPGTLTIKKVINNNYGGIKTYADFSFSVNDGQAQAFEVDGQNDLSVDAGVYNITEPAVSGYATTYDDCSSVAITNGGSATCTITNDDIAPQLTIIKHVINDNGGSAVAGNWTMDITATNPSSNNFAGQESPGVTITLNAGSYGVDESNGPSGYSTLSEDCSGSIGLGETKTCIITNNDIAPTLTLVKAVVNDNGGELEIEDFPLFINGNQVTSGVANTLTANTLYTATETNQSGYAASSWGGDCAENGTITLLPGGNKTCAITNDDIQPKLTVTKIVTNDNGGSKVIGDFPLFVGLNSVTSGQQNGFNAGVYTISETQQTGYTAAISGDCASDGSITLIAGDVKSCTITNDDISPKITVTKIVINDNGGTKQVGDFPLFVDNAPVTSGVQIAFDAGRHIIRETQQGGYTASSWGGDCDATGNITLVPGDIKACTITNNDNPVSEDILARCSDDIDNDGDGLKDLADSDCAQFTPKLTVIKIMNNDNGGIKQIGDFSLFVGSTSVASGVKNTFNPGTYIVGETPDSEYVATFSGACDGGGSVNLVIGDDKICNITNNDNPILENTQGFCSDGIDNDADGFTDLDDSDCAQFMPVNCEWSEWSAEVPTCGIGIQTRTHTQEAQYGGTECTGSFTQEYTNYETCESAGTCPTTCGYEGGIVPDGQGGSITCFATVACESAGTCPTTCGYEGGIVPDGQGGSTTCSATVACESAGTCPTTCGYSGGTVADGQGGSITCEATAACESAGTCPTTCGYTGGFVPDGQGGSTTCSATVACESAGTCPNVCGYDGGTVPNGQGGDIVCPATDACEPLGTCPTICGYEGGTVADGQGGSITCEATAACPAEEICPTTCGYEGGIVPDGQGGNKTCPVTDACEPLGTCPTTCGYSGGTVADGQGGSITCEATAACESAGTCPTTCGYGGGIVPDGQGGSITCSATVACESAGTCSYWQPGCYLAPTPTSTPEVLGASATPTPTPTPTPEVLGASITCSPYLDGYLWYGRKNPADQVKKLQQFLNDELGAKLPTTGFYGILTRASVSVFQLKYASDILQPWIDKGLMVEKKGTGNVYKTTLWKINMMMCSDLNLPPPEIP